MPPVVVTGSAFSATNSTSKGEGSSRRLSSFTRVAEYTSNGPQKSRTSMSSNRTIPTRLRSIWTPARDDIQGRQDSLRVTRDDGVLCGYDLPLPGAP